MKLSLTIYCLFVTSTVYISSIMAIIMCSFLPCNITGRDTHNLCIVCLGADHTEAHAVQGHGQVPNYSNIRLLKEHRYGAVTKVEQTLARFLSSDKA